MPHSVVDRHPTARVAPPKVLGLTEGQALLLIVAIATVLRFIGANAEYWYDEIVTLVLHVRLSVFDIVSRYHMAGHHVMNALLAHASVGIFGEHPWAVRLPAILFGIGGIWAFHFVARQLWTASIALLGTLLYSVSYYHIYYSQNARGYTAFVFFALLATGVLLKLLQAPPGRSARWYGLTYALAIGLGMYALILMAFVALGHGIVLLVAGRWRIIGWIVAGCTLALVLYAPMLADLVSFYVQRRSTTGRPLLSWAFALELAPIAPLLLIGAIVGPLLFWALARRQPIAAALLVLPIALQVSLFAVRGQGGHARSLIFGLPLAYFFLMEGLQWSARFWRLIPAGVATAILLVSSVMLTGYYRLPKQGFQQALSYIDAHRGPHDRQIGIALGGKAARFYDPSLVVIEDSDQLAEWLRDATEPTWTLHTFERYLVTNTPELHKWVKTSTVPRASFPGVVGDGTVYVRLWRPAGP